MSHLVKIIAISSIVFCLLGGLYYLLMQTRYFSGGIQTADAVRSKTDTLENTILSELDRINAIELDGAVFATDEYKALVDNSVTLTVQPLSRPNPFDKY